MKGSEIVAEILKIEGTECLFGFPLSEVFDPAAALGIRPIVARTERVAVNMADGYCRMTGGQKPAVVTVQYGAGSENAFGAIAQAYSDNTPILFLPTGYPRAESATAPNFDGRRNFQHVTKWCETVPSIEQLPQMLQYAFAQLRMGRPGPVMLELPIDILDEEGPDGPITYHPPRRSIALPNPKDVAEVVDALLNAKSPVIVAGQGILYAEATAELKELAEFIQVPVMTTLNGKSAFPENHPLSLGAGGLTRPETVDYFLNKADLVVGIGTSFTRSVYITPIPEGKTLAQITINEDDLSKDYPVSLGVIGDAKATCKQMLDDLKGRQNQKTRDDQVAQEISTVRQKFMDEWMPFLTSNEEPISPYRVIWELLQLFDREKTVITHDAGSPRDQLVPFYESIIPHGYMSWGKTTQLGTGLGLIMGAKLAKPEWLAVNVLGEAAFGMVGMDFETAVRCNLPILTVLLRNGVMGGYSNYLPIATERYQINELSGNYFGIAKALGGYSEQVQRIEDLRPALTRCIEQTQGGQPALIEIGTSEEPRRANPPK